MPSAKSAHTVWNDNSTKVLPPSSEERFEKLMADAPTEEMREALMRTRDAERARLNAVADAKVRADRETPVDDLEGNMIESQPDGGFLCAACDKALTSNRAVAGHVAGNAHKRNIAGLAG